MVSVELRSWRIEVCVGLHGCMMKVEGECTLAVRERFRRLLVSHWDEWRR